MFQLEGYHDLYNMNASVIKGKSTVLTSRKHQGITSGSSRIYDFVFIPNCGFLNSNLPLLNNCELKLSFDRVNADVAFLETGTVPDGSKITGKPIVIKDCYAISEYISSEQLRTYFNRIDNGPITYNFEECEVTLKNLPLNETDIRLDNIKGGNNPNCLFAAMIPTAGLNGDLSQSCTGFQHHDVTNVNITLNGNSVNGYPIDIKNKSCIIPLRLFNDVTNRFMNPLSGECIDMSLFKTNWIYSHKFEAEATSQGWLGIHIKLETALTSAYTLVLWTISDSALTIDKFHQIEKVSL